MLEKIFANYINELTALARILIAGICGYFVGLERTKRQKDAGVRTHFIVAAGSALIMSVSTSFSADPSRIAAQIVSGIGFLGAGMIFFRRENLHGLTTAAGIWATAGIGMAAGTGMYIIAIGGTVIMLVAQFIFHSRLNQDRNRTHMLFIKFTYNKATADFLKQTFDVKVFSRFKAQELSDKVVAEAVIRTSADCSADKLSAILVNVKEINSIERLEDL